MTYDTHELAWAAGFFDGEGNITFHHAETGVASTKGPGRTQRSRVIHLSVSQTNPEPLERFKTAVGIGSVRGPYKRAKAHWSPIWTFELGSFENVQAVVALLWRWLSTPKRNQAKKALVAWLNDPRPGGRLSWCRDKGI